MRKAKTAAMALHSSLLQTAFRPESLQAMLNTGQLHPFRYPIKNSSIKYTQIPRFVQIQESHGPHIAEKSPVPVLLRSPSFRKIKKRYFSVLILFSLFPPWYTSPMVRESSPAGLANRPALYYDIRRWKVEKNKGKGTERK
jgi:hypothetical protein